MAKPLVPPPEVNPLERDEQILDHEPTSTQSSQKVVLDLDDAPFLDDFPEEDEESPAEQSPHQPTDKSEERPDRPARSSRKLFLLGGIVVVLLLAILVFWFTRSPPPVQDELPPAPEPIPAPEPVVEEFSQPLEPFWVAFSQDDSVAFLSLRMVLVMEDPTLSLEIQRKTIILRDAVYYFLNNRPLPSLKRTDAAEALKSDLMSVMNQHLSKPLKNVLIEEYLVQ